MFWVNDIVRIWIWNGKGREDVTRKPTQLPRPDNRGDCLMVIRGRHWNEENEY